MMVSRMRKKPTKKIISDTPPDENNGEIRKAIDTLKLEFSGRLDRVLSAVQGVREDILE